jgi:hypothetical protein
MGFRSWFSVSKEIFFSPSNFFSEAPRNADSSLLKGLKFATASFFLLGTLTGLIDSFVYSAQISGIFIGVGSLGMGAVSFLFIILLGVLESVIITLIAGLLVTITYGALTHIIAGLFGIQNGLSDTIRIFLYSTGIMAYLGWIPILNVLGAIYVIYVQMAGLHEIQKLSRWKALVSVVAPGAIIIVSILILFLSSQLGYYAAL